MQSITCLPLFVFILYFRSARCTRDVNDVVTERIKNYRSTYTIRPPINRWSFVWFLSLSNLSLRLVLGLEQKTVDLLGSKSKKQPNYRFNTGDYICFRCWYRVAYNLQIHYFFCCLKFSMKFSIIRLRFEFKLH